MDSSPDEVYHDPLQSPLSPPPFDLSLPTPVPTPPTSVSTQKQPVSGLSQDDFHRIQLQLLELRTLNCQLTDENKRLKNHQSTLEEKLKAATGAGQKLSVGLSKMIPKSMKKEDGSEDEVQFLRRKLNTQEEEFRLQQSTLREELTRVMQHSDEMEAKLTDTKNLTPTQEHPPVENSSNSSIPQLETEIDGLKDENRRLKEELDQIRQEKEELSQKQRGDLESALAEAARAKEELQKIKGANDQLAEVIKERELLQQQIETQKYESGEAMKNLKQEIVGLQEKFRRKQESYVQLNKEKESQYQEYRKSLDGIVEKKDVEIKELIKEINDLKNQLKIVDEFKDRENSWKGESASLQDAVNAAKASYSEVREQNEVLQIQLQETHSANDCLSAQLQEARQDVLKMQQQTDSSVQLAEKRKQLLDEMAQHLEDAKESHAKAIRDAMEQSERERAELEQKLSEAKSSETEIAVRDEQNRVLQAENDRLKEQLSEQNRKSEEVEAEVNDALKSLEAVTANHSKELESLTVAHNLEKMSLEDRWKQELETVTKERDNHNKSTAKLQQEVADKEEQIKLIERKQSAVMRDLKRQVQSEKRRADKFQEKIQELKSELARNKSPGFEEIKSSEIETLGQPSSLQRNPETGSISSWSVVSGSNRRGRADTERDSDVDSNASATLDQEIQELIRRISSLQKEKSDLEERVNMLEESSSAMAEDLVNKSAIIQHYVKDKTVISPAPMPGSPSYSDKLKRVMDMVKVDHSASDIREMNKRLQLMLEEALTKNMHLEKNLELMTQPPPLEEASR